MEAALAQAAITEHHRKGGLNRHLLLTVLVAEKSKIKVLADLVLSEGPLPGLWTATFSLCAYRAIPRCMHVELTNFESEQE